MKLSELIKLAEEVIAKEGDLDVVVPFYPGGWEAATEACVESRYFFHPDDGGHYSDKSVALL